MKSVILKAQNRLCLQRHYHLRQLAYSLLTNNLNIRFFINFFYFVSSERGDFLESIASMSPSCSDPFIRIF